MRSSGKTLLVIALVAWCSTRPLHGAQSQDVQAAAPPSAATPPPTPTPTRSASELQQQADRQTEELNKLKAEVRSLQLSNDAAGPITRWATMWLSAIGAALGALLTAIATFSIWRLGWRVNSAFNSAQTRKLEQDRELERAKHDMTLFERLGHENLRVQLAAASALTGRLEELRSMLGPADSQLERRTIIQVLVAVVKKSDGEAAAPATWPVPTALGLSAGAKANGQGAVHPALMKLIADNLVKAMGAIVPGDGDRWPPPSIKYSPLRAFDFQKVQFQNAYWKRVDGRQVDFFRADLSNAGLKEAFLSDAILKEANLSGSVLKDARLYAADLRAANLSAADLRGADLRQADLSDADLRGAKLDRAKVFGIQVAGAKYGENPPGRVDLSPAGDGSRTADCLEWLEQGTAART